MNQDNYVVPVKLSPIQSAIGFHLLQTIVFVSAFKNLLLGILY